VNFKKVTSEGDWEAFLLPGSRMKPENSKLFFKVFPFGKTGNCGFQNKTCSLGSQPLCLYE